MLVALLVSLALVVATTPRLADRARANVRRVVRAARERWMAEARPAAPPVRPAPTATPRPGTAPALPGPAEPLERGMTVTISQVVAVMGERVTVTFAGITRPSRTDWISLYRATDPDERYGQWHYLEGASRGAVTFTAPRAQGLYEARLFLDWPRGGYTAVARSALLRVTAADPATLEVEAAASVASVATLALERGRYAPGEAVRVRFTAPRYPDSAWIGVIPSEIPHGSERVNDQHDTAYQYLSGRTAGELVFSAPRLGRWDLRIHDTDDDGRETASVSFVVARSSLDLTGVWVREDGARCRARQDGDDLWWICDPRRRGQPTVVGFGAVEGSVATLRILEVPPAPRRPTAQLERDPGWRPAASLLVLTSVAPDVLRAGSQGAEAPAASATWRRSP